jgi:Na+/H+ antiporter NhaD/arsenite permease-like protein
VFFIFVVSNCGGLLTPLGDPPLFLGFLKGVPFEWTLRLWREWLFVIGALLVVFNLYDQYRFDREERERPGSQLEQVLRHEPLALEGGHNILFLLGVMLAIMGKGYGWFTNGVPWPFGVQELLMLGLGIAAFGTTRPAIRLANNFTFAPIIEVAVLFAGIFLTMVAPLLILNAQGSRLGIATARQFFWATGVLSSFLDNAPTYLTFAATAAGNVGVPANDPQFLAAYLGQGAPASAVLAAISCGAVFMGANTYIGNGPNFMVKSIAEENGVRMPSFFGYMGYSGAILIPIFAVVSLLFF